MSNARNLADGESRFVNTAGDTMTGQLAIGGLGGLYPSQLVINASTDAVSNRATAQIDEWYLIQDTTGNGTKDFSLFKTGHGHTIVVDSAGRVTMPHQPIFQGYIVPQSPHPNGALTLPVNASLINNGNHFNTSTYTFTCPVAGYYHMHGSFMTDDYSSPSSGTGVTDIRPMKNGLYIGPAWYLDLNNVGRQIRFSGDCIVYCSANDTLTFYQAAGKIHSGEYNEFSIRLIA